MPFLILLLVAVVIWMALTFRQRRAMRDCQWRANRSKDSEQGQYYICTYCGAVRHEKSGPPKQCHKPPELR